MKNKIILLVIILISSCKMSIGQEYIRITTPLDYIMLAHYVSTDTIINTNLSFWSKDTLYESEAKTFEDQIFVENYPIIVDTNIFHELKSFVLDYGRRLNESDSGRVVERGRYIIKFEKDSANVNTYYLYYKYEVADFYHSLTAIADKYGSQKLKEWLIGCFEPHDRD